VSTLPQSPPDGDRLLLRRPPFALLQGQTVGTKVRSITPLPLPGAQRRCYQVLHSRWRFLIRVPETPAPFRHRSFSPSPNHTESATGSLARPRKLLSNTLIP